MNADQLATLLRTFPAPGSISVEFIDGAILLVDNGGELLATIEEDGTVSRP